MLFFSERILLRANVSGKPCILTGPHVLVLFAVKQNTSTGGASRAYASFSIIQSDESACFRFSTTFIVSPDIPEHERAKRHPAFTVFEG